MKNYRLQLISLSHIEANTSVRKTFFLNDDKAILFMKALRQQFDLKGLLVLCTCNRVEIYLEATENITQKVLEKWFAFQQVPYDRSLFNGFLRLHQTDQVAAHLLEVISGLRSMVVGDFQIHQQYKAALRQSQNLKFQGSLLERLSQAAFRVHKRIQNETSFRDGSASVSYLSLKAISKIFEKTNLQSKRLLLVGAGQTVKEIVRCLPKFQFGKVGITNRTANNAKRLAQQYNMEVHPLADLNRTILNDYDIIITALSNSPNFFQAKNWSEISHKQLILDLAMPNNVDSTVGALPNITLINLDDLLQIAKQNLTKRDAAIPAVQKIVGEEHKKLVDWHHKRTINFQPSFGSIGYGIKKKNEL